MIQRFRDILHALPGWALWAVVGLSLAGGAIADEDASSIRLETFRTHSRLRIHIDDGVSSQLTSDRKGFELFLKGIGLADLGAPLGDEAKWAAQFRSPRDPRLADLEFAEVAGGLKVRGHWKYGSGPDAPANPMMEAFDYRERDHTALVIDFWVKEGPTVGQVRARKAVTRRIASVKKHEDDERARAERRLARERARALAEDPKLFCKTPLTERSDVFLQFLPVHEPVAFSRWFSTAAPDADYSFYAPQGKAKDAQYVRLAQKLYKEGNFALANRTVEFFEQECPDSTFRQEMRFLKASTLLKLGLADEALAILRELAREPKGSQVSLHAGMYLALKQFEDKNYLAALESFTWLGDHQSEHRQAWVFHLGAAECARALRQTDRAAFEYQWVADHAPDAASQAEGALRIGDLYLDRFQYDQALAAYAIALRHYGKEAESFPAIHINRADSLYGLGQLERANQAYREFLKQFPAHPDGWRASYRLGELEARNEHGTREDEGAAAWFLETINRYPFSPGARLARMQLLPCGKHAGMTVDAAQRFFAEEAERFDGGGEVAMDRFKDFRALSHVRTLMTLGEQETAVATAISELRRVPRAQAARWLGHLLVFNFRKAVMEQLEKGDKLAALTFYEKNADTVPLTDGTVDPDYLLKLSQAASELSLGKLAESVGATYEKARKARAEAARELASDPGLATDPDVRLEAAERAFTEAEALWIAQGMKAEDEVRARLGQVVPESRFSYERELILGLIEDRNAQPQAALRHAAQAQLLGPRDARLDAWVASLQARAGDARAALAAYRRLERELGRPADDAKGKSEAAGGQTLAPEPGAAERLGVGAVPAREALILAESEILEKEGRWGESAANYARAVGQGLAGAEARYGFARALLRVGGKENREKALATLEKLAGEDAAPPPSAGAAAGGAKAENERFWRKLASETLADEKAKNGAKEGMKQ